MSPRLVVHVAVLDDAGRVLVVRDESGFTLPGGPVPVTVSVDEGVRARVRELTGAEIAVDEVLTSLPCMPPTVIVTATLTGQAPLRSTWLRPEDASSARDRSQVLVAALAALRERSDA